MFYMSECSDDFGRRTGKVYDSKYRFVKYDPDLEPFVPFIEFVEDLYDEDPRDIGLVTWSVRWAFIWAVMPGGTFILGKRLVDLVRDRVSSNFDSE